MKTGTVYLVGAGPGAADLLTLRAVKILGEADVVLYDRLVGDEILDFIPAAAERIYAGKNLGADSTARQERVYALMIAHANQGKTVVRLKGGDPFVFGRGGEELLRLKAAAIDAVVVPGISSCISAPESALIPVTFRGVAGSFGVFAGHPGDTGRVSQVDWQAAARVDTAVFLMGVARLPLIVSNLMARGRGAETPVAVIERASTPEQRVTTGTLADIVEKSKNAKPPATIVVGEVVRVREAVVGNVALEETLELAWPLEQVS